MNLTQYEKGDYIQSEGMHTVMVTDAKESMKFNQDGYSVTFRNNHGNTLTAFLSLSEKVWLIAKLARACGCTDEQMEDFEPELLIGKSCVIQVNKKVSTQGKDFYNYWDAFPIDNHKPAEHAKPSGDVPF